MPTVQVRVLKCVAVSIQHQNGSEISFSGIVAQGKTVLLLSILLFIPLPLRLFAISVPFVLCLALARTFLNTFFSIKIWNLL